MCVAINIRGLGTFSPGDKISFTVDGVPKTIQWANTYSFRRIETLLKTTAGDLSKEQFLLFPVESIIERNNSGTLFHVPRYMLEFPQPASVVFVRSFYDPSWVLLTEPTPTLSQYGYPDLYHHRIPVVCPIESSVNMKRSEMYPNVLLSEVALLERTRPTNLVALEDN
ncbi:MAG: hypothetical protein KatS3mg087_0486 [Patescibacteria group bacterium]|nr:MAG: hypothetical protein KatS3mg087_0486 [Patescibacteria group bacterium]